MSRKLMTILLSGALVFANVGTKASSATQTSDPVNQAPLPPAGAAGIKQAQGLSDNPGLVIVGAIGVVALIWILVDDDDGVDTPTTGTN